MPVFHTKTIESILDPVAQQVSRLVIIHEEGEAGHEMPDLERPVLAVSKAVANLAKVGREMVTTTEDSILKQDMPIAINKVENAASLLEDASNLSKGDPYSKTARTKLIEGSRWILQGTSGVLLCFDESEVRKIIRECKKVLDYLSVAEVIDSMEDLVQFVKDLSPCLSKVTREVEKRVEDLTHQTHRESLSKCVDQIKTLAPILICSMKIFIQIVTQGGKGNEEAAENRNYLASRMTDEVGEIVRVLQLVTYDEEEWSSDNIQVMKKTIGSIDGKMQSAQDWLRDPMAVQGGVGEKSLRSIVELAEKVAERSLPLDAEHLRRLAGDVSAMTDALCELRASGRGATPQAENLARNIQSRLGEVVASVGQAASRLEKSGIQQPAPTVTGRLEQCRRWLEQPGVDDRGVGPQALQLIVDEARKVAEGLPPYLKSEILGLCSRVEAEQGRLLEAVRRGEAGQPQAVNIARSLTNNIGAVADCIQGALVDRVVDDFVDIATPLKQFTDCVLVPGDPNTREQVFDVKSANLVNFSNRVVGTAKLVATGNTSGNKKLAEALLATAGQVESLTPQLVNAGRIRMVYPENKAADEHFENLRRQFAETVTLTRTLADEATDSARFIGQSAVAMQQHTARCDEAIATKQPPKMVESTSSIARLANRVLQLTKQEADNSEDPKYISVLNIAAEQLQTRVSPMVQCAKSVAINIDDQSAIDSWRRRNGLLLEAVQSVHKAVQSNSSGEEEPPLPPYPDVRNLRLEEASKMAAVTQSAQFSPQHSTTQSSSVQPGHIFSDDELSEIFQIDFGQIFGNPEAGLKSNYKGIQSKRTTQAQSNSTAVSTFSPPLSPVPPPVEFQSSPKLAPKLGRSKSNAAVPIGRQAVCKSKSSSAIAIAKSSSNSSQSYRQETVTNSRSYSSSSSSKQVFHQESKSSNAYSRNAVVNNGKIATSTAAEADVLIEELMEEAKNDPSFGVLDRLSSRPESAADTKPIPAPKKTSKEEKPLQAVLPIQMSPADGDSRPGSSMGAPVPDKYPFIPRPYRTAQDMIIRDKSEERTEGRASRTPDKHSMPKRPYRTATDFKIEDTTDAYNRSKSADGRLGKAFKNQDPKLSSFKRTSSTENFTGEMMHEVVTDNEHKSVKDLVARLEKSTKAQSENPYIRKWGCDLISPEPRRRNVTCRYQRKQMPDPEFASKLQHQYSDYGSRTSSRTRNLSETSRESPLPSQHLENDFQLTSYTADIDDLIDRQHGEQDIGLICQEEGANQENIQEDIRASEQSSQFVQNQEVSNTDADTKIVVWPPTSPSPTIPAATDNSVQVSKMGNNEIQMQGSNSSSQQVSMQRSETFVSQQSHSVQQSASVKNFIVNESENIVKRRKDKKMKSNVEDMNRINKEESKKTTNGSHKYSRNSLRELDAQIMDIQTQFESELESLVDMYKTLQKRKSQGLLTVDKSTEELSTLRSNNSTIRRFCVPPL